MNFNTTKNEIKNVVTGASSNIANETLDMAKINIGKIIYSNVRVMFDAYVPKPSFIKKLLVGKEKLEVAELLAVYGLLHIAKTKYSHYLIDAVTSYINFELQNKLIGSINIKDLDNIFKLPTKVE